MTEQRKRGPILVKKGSKEAKRIEDTHGFNAALRARNDRDQAAPAAAKPAATPASSED